MDSTTGSTVNLQPFYQDYTNPLQFLPDYNVSSTLQKVDTSGILDWYNQFPDYAPAITEYYDYVQTNRQDLLERAKGNGYLATNYYIKELSNPYRQLLEGADASNLTQEQLDAIRELSSIYRLPTLVTDQTMNYLTSGGNVPSNFIIDSQGRFTTQATLDSEAANQAKAASGEYTEISPGVYVPTGSAAQTNLQNPDLYNSAYNTSMQNALTGTTAGTTSPTGTTQPSTYTIQSGDTLSAIAARNGMTLDQLLALNPQFTAQAGRDPNLIYPGETVNLGAVGGATGTGGMAGTAGGTGTIVGDGSINLGINSSPTGASFPSSTGMSASDYLNYINSSLSLYLSGNSGTDAPFSSSGLEDARDDIRNFFDTRKTAEQIIREEYERRGIGDKNDLLSELDRLILEQTRRIRALPENIQRGLEDVGVTQGQLDRLIVRESQKPSEILRDLMEERNALGADIDRAVEYADKFIGTKLEDQAAKLAALEWELDQAEADQDRYDALTAQASKDALTEQKEMMNIALDIASNGAPQEVIDRVLASDSLADAISTAGGYLTSVLDRSRLSGGGSTGSGDILSPLDIQRLEDTYGVTLPYGTTENQAINIINSSSSTSGGTGGKFLNIDTIDNYFSIFNSAEFSDMAENLNDYLKSKGSTSSLSGAQLQSNINDIINQLRSAGLSDKEIMNTLTGTELVYSSVS